ncbi:hypothetical protein CRENBAI_011087 [Crenichthys baileyi]|uniref:Uncharacterized protein n=1 Tax=Crenichthys baileyi TaxID=28760 RepID=A0AAV9SL41_9TELE
MESKAANPETHSAPGSSSNTTHNSHYKRPPLLRTSHIVTAIPPPLYHAQRTPIHPLSLDAERKSPDAAPHFSAALCPSIECAQQYQLLLHSHRLTLDTNPHLSSHSSWHPLIQYNHPQDTLPSPPRRPGAPPV